MSRNVGQREQEMRHENHITENRDGVKLNQMVGRLETPSSRNRTLPRIVVKAGLASYKAG